MLTCLIALGWWLAALPSNFLYSDSGTFCYSCWDDESWPFEAGKYAFAALLLLRIVQWKRRVLPVELIAALLSWAYLLYATFDLGLDTSQATIRRGNWPLLGWVVCLLALGPLLITLERLQAQAAASSDATDALPLGLDR